MISRASSAPHLPSTVSNSRLARRSRGYALLLVLAVLALAGTLLALIVRRTASQTRDVLMAERALQTKWGMASCESLLAHAEDLLVAPDSTGKPRPAAERSFQFNLGKRKVTVVLADEQAKPNLNALAGLLNPTQLTTLLRERTNGAEVSLAPLAGDRPFVCWEQVCPGLKPADPRAALLSTNSHFTLWGDGKLRLQAASAQASTDFLHDILDSTQIEQLRAAVQRGLSVRDAVALLPKELRTQAEARLTDDSKAQSAWIILEEPSEISGAGPRDVRFVVVMPEEKTQMRRFSWP